MLKSTYPSNQQPLHAPHTTSLPPEWSEFTAPTGHTYYYNRETKQSTYVRPAQHVNAPPPGIHPSRDPYIFTGGQDHVNSYAAVGALPHLQSQHPSYSRNRYEPPQDRPKSKHAIPGCAAWVLVKTKLGRRFVHNLTTNESFWKFPEEVIGGVVEYDIQERERRSEQTTGANRQALGESRHVLGERAVAATEDDQHDVLGEEADEDATASAANRPVEPVDGQDQTQAIRPRPGDLSDEYEEVEVTDSENEDGETASKRPRWDAEPEDQDQPIEFDEDDMARQLAEMGETYRLDPGEYGDGEGVEGEDWEEGAEGLMLTEEEAAASFRDLLDDFRISPYTMWDTVISEGHIIEDDRYTLLSTMKSRKEVFTQWSVAKVEQHRLQKERAVKQDPRIPYLAFVEKYATPKLFWPEFRRKFKKEPELKDTKLSDKDREKLYRDYTNRITKSSEPALKGDLQDLLRSITPSEDWNSSTNLEGGLPPALLTDLRYISLKASVREPMIKAFIDTLPSARDAAFERDETESVQQRAERERRDLALRRRGMQVEEAKLRQEKELRFGRSRLREEEQQLSRAMRVGKEGLRGQFESHAQSPSGPENPEGGI